MPISPYASVFLAAALIGGCATATTETQRACPEAPASEVAAPPVHVAAAADLPLKWAPNGTADMRELARGLNAFVAVLRMDPGARVPLHRDESEEYIYVLEGTGDMTIDGRTTVVGPGTIVYMPSGAEVAFINRDAEFRALQVFADPTSSAKYRRWLDAKPASAVSP